ncbi:MAG: immunoglobulin domain-containing protein, partial [Verrucomicrobia bacterium]|nr:immunoglobulin domain-containing protein [Verrucomicrobiota bacterium]
MMLAAGLVVAIPAQADQWQQRASGISARTSHTVVWTGTEMIAWGGGGEGTFLNSGGRYTPATDSWLPTSLTNAPSGRWMHAAVWTGTEMLVWGGRAHFDWLNHFDTGGRYDPATDTWRPMSAEGAPAPRSQMAAVWTGSELLVWGGMANNYGAHADGARYDPATDTWTPMAAANAPSARVEPTAIWTGTEMIVWGGVLYDPQTKVWTTYNDGARYNPVTDTWTPMTTEDAPESRTGHTAVWTGMRMLVWGGRQLPLDAYLNSGGSYDPQTDSWSVLATNMAPGKRAYHAAVWTGSEMLVWGGCDPFPSGWLDTGARYDPASDAWTPMTQVNAPAARFFWRPDAGLWTGEGMLLFGGSRYSEMSAQNSYYLPNAAPPQCAPVPPGLVSWWRAEGDAVDAAGGHDGSVLNGAGFAGGRVGSAFSTAAFGQRVIVADAAAFELTESLTIEGWVFIHGDGGIVFMRGDNRTGLDSWILWLTGPQRLSFRICSATEAVEVEGPVLYEQWQHVAATLDGASGEMRLYVNGSVVGQTNTPVRPLGPLEGPEPGLAIGNHSGTSLDFGFRGLIDELSLYGRALSAAEVGRIYEASSWGKCRTGQAPVIVHHPQTQSVQAGGTARFAVEATGTPPPVYIWLFNGEPIAGATASVLELANVQLTQAGNYSVIATNDFGFAVSETATLTVEEPPLECLPAPSSLVGWWPGNGDSADAAGTNSAVLIGGAAFGVGKVGQGFDLNGSTAFVRVPASSAIDVGAGDGLTVETWIRPDDVGSERPVAEWHRWSGNGFGVHLRVGKLPGNLYASLVDTTGADHVIDTPAATIVAGTWQHVALTYDKGGGVAKLYVNGTLAREVSVGSFTPQTTYDLNIGALASSLGAALLFDGVIDEVSVYGRALATAELQAIFGAGTAGKCPPAPPPVRTYDLSADYTLASNP